jgi:hypothetical protein
MYRDGQIFNILNRKKWGKKRFEPIGWAAWGAFFSIKKNQPGRHTIFRAFPNARLIR